MRERLKQRLLRWAVLVVCRVAYRYLTWWCRMPPDEAARRIQEQLNLFFVHGRGRDA